MNKVMCDRCGNDVSGINHVVELKILPRWVNKSPAAIAPDSSASRTADFCGPCKLALLSFFERLPETA